MGSDEDPQLFQETIALFIDFFHFFLRLEERTRIGTAGLNLGGHRVAAFVVFDEDVCLAEAGADAEGEENQGQHQEGTGQEHFVHHQDVRRRHGEVHVENQEKGQERNVFPIFMRADLIVFDEDFIKIAAQPGDGRREAEGIEKELCRIDDT